MQHHTINILKDYDSSKQTLDSFCNKTKILITDLLQSNSISYHQITERVKDKSKLEGKILRKNHKYTSINDITDIVGIRIITYFEDEVDKIARIISQEFNIDIENSIDKRELETDKFGYRSLHYVVSLNDNRSKLTEYKQYADLKFEIQIRTILQHSWAEIEHDIGYKGEVAIPQFAKRTFYRVAALLETADSEFVNLKNLLNDYENSVSYQINEMPESVTIDKASLASFIRNSSVLDNIDLKLANYLSVPLLDEDIVIDDLLEKFNRSNIRTIKELEEQLSKNMADIYSNFTSAYPKTGSGIVSVQKGVSIFQLLDLVM